MQIEKKLKEGEWVSHQKSAAADSKKKKKKKKLSSKRKQRNSTTSSLLSLFLSLSASWDVFGFVASLEARVGRVEALLAGSEQSPAGSLGYVIQGWEALQSPTLLVSLDQLLETLVVDPCPPLAVHLELREGRERNKVVDELLIQPFL